MWIPALDETLDDLFLHRAPHSARFAKFLAMPRRALPQRARARVARQVEGRRAPAPCRHPNFPTLVSLGSVLPFRRKRTSRIAINIKRSASSSSNTSSTADIVRR
jgi:hypothetical protein